MFRLKSKNMKKITFFFILCALPIFSQSNETKNLLTLKNEINSSFESQQKSVNYFQSAEIKKKKTGLAILYSLLLPGMGELYAESYSSGKYFTIADGTLWAIYIGMNTYGNWQRDRYKSYAQANAGISPAGKDEDYFATIGDYLSVDEFNNAQALNREFTKMYKSSSYSWDWQSVADRKNYRSMWVKSEQTFNNLRFVVGALLINRIASAISAVRAVSAYNKRNAQEVSWNISAGVSQNVNLPPSVTLNFQTTF